MKNSVKEVKVGLNFGDNIIPVGRLAINNRQFYFQYHDSFILVITFKFRQLNKVGNRTLSNIFDH